MPPDADRGIQVDERRYDLDEDQIPRLGEHFACDCHIAK